MYEEEQNSWMQNPYQQGYTQNVYQQPYTTYGGQPEKQKGESIGFGIASMILGIVALIFFCTGCNILFAILAIVFGIVQLVKNKQKAFAITGIITAGLSMLLFIMLYVMMVISAGTSDYYDDYYDNYYDGYGYYGDEL